MRESGLVFLHETAFLKKSAPLQERTTTFLTRTGPAQLGVERYSTTGFNALELHLLADWLESPQFPRGSHTALAPPPPAPPPPEK